MVLAPKFRPDMVNLITTFLRDSFVQADRSTAVVGLSGGVDSSLVVKLCADALGARHVLGIGLPEDGGSKKGLDDAKTFAEDLGIRFEIIKITRMVRTFGDALGEADRRRLGNIKARTRMIVLYDISAKNDGMVVGTGNKSEVATSYFCYDPQTRVMTPDGPKYYWELHPGELVFSLELETRQIVEVPLESVHVFDYKGDLIEIRTKRLDLLVTPNHRLLIVRTHGKGSTSFATAESRFVGGCTVLATPQAWEGNVIPPALINTENFLGNTVLASNANMPVEMATEDFLYLMGLVIGDGCLSTGHVPFQAKTGLPQSEWLHHRDDRGRFTPALVDLKLLKTYDAPRIFIASTEGKRSRRPLLELLDRYEIHATKTPTFVTFTNRALSAAFMHCGVGAKHKRIPPWVLKFPADQLSYLYHGLMDSDGRASGHSYSSTSRQLAYQMVELCAKLGIHAWVQRLPGRYTYYKEKLIRSSPIFDVRISPIARSLVFTRKNMHRVPYKGKVWCPSVPPYENVLVERNGRVVFCGNTKYGDGGVDLLPIGDLYKTQVWEMAHHLGLPKAIIEKKPTAGLWNGQTDEGELGISYAELDPILLGIEMELEPEEVASRTGLDLVKVRRIEAMVRAGAHKRKMPPIPKVGIRTFGLDWKE